MSFVVQALLAWPKGHQAGATEHSSVAVPQWYMYSRSHRGCLAAPSVILPQLLPAPSLKRHAPSLPSVFLGRGNG
jgi:hypothetical protein